MTILNSIRKVFRPGALAGESGQSLVETAFILPLMVTMLIGAADLAQVAYTSIAVANAAKAGAQYGCQSGYTAIDGTGIITAAAAEAPNVTLTTTSSSTCICSDGSSSTCANTDCPNSHIEQTLTVSTSTTVTPLIHLPVLPSTYTVKGKAVERVWQ
jgi:Flp pilus assembly protein TadG